MLTTSDKLGTLVAWNFSEFLILLGSYQNFQLKHLAHKTKEVSAQLTASLFSTKPTTKIFLHSFQWN